MFFYWISWLYMIVITFFFGNAKVRRKFSILLLLIIAFSQSTISILNVDIYISYLLLTSVFLLTYLNQLTKFFLSLAVFFLSVSYVGLRYITIVSPVWLFIPQPFMLTIVYLIISIIVAQTKKQRYVIACLPILLGEAIFSFSVLQLNWYVSIGAPYFISQVFIQLGVLLLIEKGSKLQLVFKDLIVKFEPLKKEIS